MPSYKLASDSVIIDGVNPLLLAFVDRLSGIHQLLFDEPIVITSGKDGTHGLGSLHPHGRAVDLRTRDLTQTQLGVFLSILAYECWANNMIYMDESALVGESHIHIEYRS